MLWIPQYNSTKKFLLQIIGSLNTILLSLMATYIPKIIRRVRSSTRAGIQLNNRHLYYPPWKDFIAFLISLIILVLVSLLNFSDYIIYIVDNSGSMGGCKYYNEKTEKCELRANEDEYPIYK